MTLKYGLELGGPTIIISEESLTTMLKYRQLGHIDTEAGGQLFARFEGQNTYVLEATPPKPLDVRRRFVFRPNQWLQRLEIRTKYPCGKHFVGDWHTHPEPIPSPSQEDLDSSTECFRRSRHQLKAFLMVIVGTADPPDGLVVYLVNKFEMQRLKHFP